MDKIKENWFISMKKADFKGIGEMFNISPILARIIRNRDIIEHHDIDLYLNGTINDLYDGMLLKDMGVAVDILKEKIQNKESIRIIGDYDVDGVNSTYILEEGLRKLGAKVDTDIPDRIADGYGLNPVLIDRALEDNVDTIITCDNGIAAYDEIAYGKSMGLTIIVTDHHKVPYIDVGGEREYLMPPADAVVNPYGLGCTYEFKGLCGAAIAYKVIEALYEVMNENPEDVDYLIENVALATICDVMDLINENRIFVIQGLEMLRRTKNLGLKALMAINDIDPKYISAYHVGYIIGPCLNASGRLDTAKKALKLLNSTTYEEALGYANELKQLNENRKEMTAKGVENAISIIENSSINDHKVLVVYLEDCHESIAGIIAGRIRERYYKPTFILTDGEGFVKGSGRSIDGYHMFDELCKCRALLIRFGGHRLAAGLSLKRENIDELRNVLNETCQLTHEDLTEKITIDMELPFQYATIELTEELKKIEPFGKGNKTPLFAARNVRISNPGIFGKDENVLRFQAKDQYGTSVDGVYFGEARKCLDYITSKGEVSITYYPKINEYMGEVRLQIVMKNYK